MDYDVGDRVLVVSGLCEGCAGTVLEVGTWIRVAIDGDLERLFSPQAPIRRLGADTPSVPASEARATILRRLDAASHAAKAPTYDHRLEVLIAATADITSVMSSRAFKADLEDFLRRRLAPYVIRGTLTYDEPPSAVRVPEE